MVVHREPNKLVNGCCEKQVHQVDRLFLAFRMEKQGSSHDCSNDKEEQAGHVGKIKKKIEEKNNKAGGHKNKVQL